MPIPIHKEQPGYIINSLIAPWCTAALGLLVSGVSDVESIDRAWMIAMRSGRGPFGMMDLSDEHFIQKGRLGVVSGQGVYSYPNPTFAQPGFI